MNVIHRLVIAGGLWGCVALGIAEGQTYADRDGNGLIDILYIEQLDSMRYNLTGACSGSICNGYELKRSLDFRDSLSYRNYRRYISSTHDSSFYARGEGWRPVGTATYVYVPLQEDNPFNTLFEGNRFTLNHLFINRRSTHFVGLFGYTGSNSTLRNIGIRNVSVTGNNFVGGLVGYNYYGTISQSYATGAVTGAYTVGGLVGWNRGTISQSYATGAVTGAHSVGGLVGVNWYGGTISQSYATGAVSGIGNVGGLVGANDNGTISQSYATGAVSGTQFVGGLVGVNVYGTIHHGYWNVDAPQTVNGTVRSTHNKVGIDYRVGPVIETHIRSLTLSALESPTGTAADTIQELGPGFIYKQGFLPYIHRGARVTVNGVHFTQTIPSWTNIDTNSIVTNVMQGTDTTRATLTADGIPFTANIIGTTNITSPYTLRNIQNGTGEGIVGKYGTKIHFAALGMKTYGDAPFVLSATSSAHLPLFFSASNTIVSIKSDTVIIHGGGTVSITAYSLENDTVVFGFTNQILAIRKSIPMDRDLDGLIDILYIEQLDSMRYNLTGACSGSICNGYELKRSLDFRDSLSYRNYRSYISSTHDSSFYAREEGWRPVGSATYVNGTLQEGNPFNTLFEGNGNTIDHLYIQRSTTSYVGLFGYTGSNSIVRNIGLRTVSVTGNDFVGGLVGWNNGAIIQTYATGSVTGAYGAGGLVGVNWYGGTISQSYATGAVSGRTQVGGLVGGNNGSISQSYATGAVSGNTYGVGGLVGWNHGTISQSYATGAVSGTQFVGGLIGINYNGTVHHVYWNVDAPQTVNGTVRSTHNTVGIDYRVGPVIETHIRSLTLSALESPTGTAADTIQELGPGFIYKQGFLPYIHRGARLTVHSIHFTQTIPSWTNIDTNSIVANVIQGTDTTRATLTVDGIPFTANIIGTTNITSPYTLRNIQNGTGEGIVGKYGTKIHFAALGMKTYGDAPFVLSATSSAHLPLFFSASNTIVSIKSDTVIIHGGGTVSITAYSLETDTIGFTSATQILTIHKVFQSIEFGVLASKTFGDAPFVVSASSSAHLSVFFSASNTIVNIKSNTIIINRAGTVNITAYSLETDTIGFTSATQILTIHKGVQSIEFGVLASKTFGDAPFVLSARSTAGLPILFSASNTIVNIKSNTIIINGAGAVHMSAYNEGNEHYLGASTTQILTIHKGIQSIEFRVLASKTLGDAPFVVSARSSAHLPLLFSASNTIVNIKSNTIIINGAGTVNIIAYCLENNDYFRAFTTRILTISKGIQSIEFGELASKILGDVPFVLSARSSAHLPLLFSASNTIVNIKSNTIIINGAGTVNIIAYCLENNDYFRAFTTRILTISKGIQSIEFGELASKILGDVPFVLSARSSAGLPVFFSASNAFITIRNNTVSMNRAGAVHIRAYNEGNEHYLGASATQILFITKPIDTVTTDANFTFAAIPNMTVGQRYFLITHSQSPVYATFKSSNERIAIINQDILTAIAAGTITITAHQEAFAPYRAATARQTVIVVRPTSIPPHPLTPIETKNSAIRIFPNPTKDYITIQTNEKISSVKVYDMVGKSYELGIKNYELGSRVDIKILPKGEYILVIYGENGEVLKAEKVIITD